MELTEPIRLIATDLDGTLLNDNYEISTVIKDAIQRARQNGVEVVVTTGRDRASALKYIETIHLTDTFIGSGGAEIWREGKIIETISLTLDQTRWLMGIVTELDCGSFVDQLPYTWNFGNRKYVEMYLHVSDAAQKTEDVETFYHPLPNKISIINEPEVLAEIRPRIVERYPSLHLTTPFSHILDVNPTGADKGTAILHLAALMNIPASQIAAVGDSDNDIAMLDVAAVPFAVGNAVETVKQRVRCIAPSNNENGVAWMIDEILAANAKIKR
ncbi:MAG: Cof-type HAD-IIB family hydrolase [Anaerolineaceae bacterium]|nr:Cof-type HAD-IIB family hydrolase [Anaerolineaceae bacterium]